MYILAVAGMQCQNRVLPHGAELGSLLASRLAVARALLCPLLQSVVNPVQASEPPTCCITVSGELDLQLPCGTPVAHITH